MAGWLPATKKFMVSQEKKTKRSQAKRKTNKIPSFLPTQVREIQTDRPTVNVKLHGRTAETSYGE